MNLKVQKKIAGKLLKASPNRIRFDVNSFDQIKEAITRHDVRALIENGVISKINKAGTSRTRANYIRLQKSKGKRKGLGSRKGTANARLNNKESWIIKVRSLRNYIHDLKQKNKISVQDYRLLYRKIKGGFFRSLSHLNLYLTEKELWIGEKNAAKPKK